MIISKGIAGLVIVASLLFTLTVSSAQALSGRQNRPSQWAEKEVSDAIEMGLVPEELKGNYQSNIKRYEYVLLALKLFEKTGKNIDIIDNQPFSDILNHKYQQDIVKAYNAGIVKGDGKGYFHPDNYITRQEIASLVVNLLMQIAPGKDFTVKNSYEYSDSNEISDWARFYIDFCFENKILAGYGNNIIDPKGYASIEQSIALLYRLARNEGLLAGAGDITHGSINLDDISYETITGFINEYNTETFNIIKNAAGNKDIEVTIFWEKSATISFKYNTISLNSPAFEKNLFALIHEMDDELFIATYKELLLKNFNGGEKGVLLFEQYIEKMKANEVINVYEEIDETEVFTIESIQDIDNSISYLMGYIQRKQ